MYVCIYIYSTFEPKLCNKPNYFLGREPAYVVYDNKECEGFDMFIAAAANTIDVSETGRRDRRGDSASESGPEEG